MGNGEMLFRGVLKLVVVVYLVFLFSLNFGEYCYIFEEN